MICLLLAHSTYEVYQMLCLYSTELGLLWFMCSGVVDMFQH